MKSKLKWNGISLRKLEASASDRSTWRSFTSRTFAFEEDRCQCVAAATDRRHRTASTSAQTTDYHCYTCGCLCASSLDCEVTCALIAESIDCVIVGQRRTTNMFDVLPFCVENMNIDKNYWICLQFKLFCFLLGVRGKHSFGGNE